nr:MAG TPA_asm: hypothetical protein [Caudoviricetes sp.]
MWAWGWRAARRICPAPRGRRRPGRGWPARAGCVPPCGPCCPDICHGRAGTDWPWPRPGGGPWRPLRGRLWLRAADGGLPHAWAAPSG